MEETINERKCGDCHSSDSLSQRFMQELTLGRLITCLSVIIAFTFSIGAGSTTLYNSIEQTAKNKSVNDSILIVVSGLHENVVVIADHLKKTGAIPDNSCFLKEPKKPFELTDNTIYNSDDEEERKRACVKLTSTKSNDDIK